MRHTDVANQQQLFHLIQSIPSPKIARENIEKRVGSAVISALNAKDKPALDTGTQAPEIQ